jgi:hypothetical protein
MNRKCMRNVCNRIVGSWGTQFRLNVAQYLWILSMFGVLAGLEHNRIGLFKPTGWKMACLSEAAHGRSW